MIPVWINRIRIRSPGVGIATSTRVTTGCMKILLLALALLPPVAAEADGFTQQCERLAAGARIEVLFEEPQVTRDDSRSRDELMRLSQSSRNPNHAVLGLTQAEAGRRAKARKPARTAIPRSNRHHLKSLANPLLSTI